MKAKDLQAPQNSNVSVNDAYTAGNAEKKLLTAEDIQDWLVSHLAELLGVDSDEIDVKIPFERYGLDSSASVGLTSELEEWLGHEIDPTMLYDYPTIEAQAQYLAEEVRLKM